MTGYAVVVERDEHGGFGAWSPDLPGCIAAADTYDECVQLMREAVVLHIESLRAHGDPVPSPSTVGLLTVEAA